MAFTENTLRLLRHVLVQTPLNANADRAEILAVLDARDEIDTALAVIEDSKVVAKIREIKPDKEED